MKKATIVLALVGSAGWCSWAAADRLRCSGKIVAKGDSMQRVRSLCGEPDHILRRADSLSFTRRVPTAGCIVGVPVRLCVGYETYTTERPIEEWVYDFGPDRLIQHLIFETGELQEVESQGYGGAPR